MAKPYMTEELISQACDLREAGRSLGRISLKLGVPEKTIDYHLRKRGAFPAGWKHRGERRKPENRNFTDSKGRVVRGFTPEEDEKLKALDAKGLGYSAIGREIGRQPNSVRARLTALANRAQCAEGA